MENSKFTKFFWIMSAVLMTFSISTVSLMAEEMVKVNRNGSKSHMKLDADGQWQVISITKTTKEGKILSYDMSKNQPKLVEPAASPAPTGKPQ